MNELKGQLTTTSGVIQASLSQQGSLIAELTEPQLLYGKLSILINEN